MRLNRNRKTSLRKRDGFNLVELLVVIGVLVILTGLLLPVTRSSRSGARRTDCANRLRQLTLSIHSYHDSNQKLPPPVGVTFGNSNNDKLSGFALLLPYMDRDDLFDTIASPLNAGNSKFPALGPDPLVSGYAPWQKQLPDMQCPSSSDPESEFGYSNYMMCIGDVANDIHDPRVQRGAFAVGRTCSFDDFTDGTSTTIMMAEVATESGTDVQGQFAVNQSPKLLKNPSLVLELEDPENSQEFLPGIELSQRGRGGSWADGMAGHSMVNTILRPGSPSAAVMGNRGVDGYYSASSYHSAGVNVGMADGSVRCINRGIYAGDPKVSPLTQQEMAMGNAPSPYGIWGALGTIAGEEPRPLNF